MSTFNQQQQSGQLDKELEKVTGNIPSVIAPEDPPQPDIMPTTPQPEIPAQPPQNPVQPEIPKQPQNPDIAPPTPSPINPTSPTELPPHIDPVPKEI